MNPNEIMKVFGCGQNKAGRLLREACEMGILERFQYGNNSYKFRFVENQDEVDDEDPF